MGHATLVESVPEATTEAAQAVEWTKGESLLRRRRAQKLSTKLVYERTANAPSFSPVRH
jgi:hypothetical protein